MSHGRDARDLVEQLYVPAGVGKLVVADEDTVRQASRHVELLRIYLREEFARVAVNGVQEIIGKLFLTDVQYLDLQVIARVGVLDEDVQPSPACLEFLEVGMVQDLVDLSVEALVYAGDQRV